MAKRNSFISTLERDLDKNHLSQHPFYQLWNEGALPLPALQHYAQQYYHFVAQFPRFVSRVHSNTPYTEDRIAILDNLTEEEDKKLPHDEMWVRFAEGIGVNRENIQPKAYSETKKALATIQSFCDKDFLQGSAALLAYEAQISEIAELKKKGLKKFYNVTSKRALKFFDVHGKVDIEHQKTWKHIIAKHAVTKTQQRNTQRALNQSLQALWQLLDGVYRRHCDV